MQQLPGIANGQPDKQHLEGCLEKELQLFKVRRLSSIHKVVVVYRNNICRQQRIELSRKVIDEVLSKAGELATLNILRDELQ